jgi:hypothetical protein
VGSYAAELLLEEEEPEDAELDDEPEDDFESDEDDEDAESDEDEDLEDDAVLLPDDEPRLSFR